MQANEERFDFKVHHVDAKTRRVVKSSPYRMHSIRGLGKIFERPVGSCKYFYENGRPVPQKVVDEFRIDPTRYKLPATPESREEFYKHKLSKMEELLLKMEEQNNALMEKMEKVEAKESASLASLSPSSPKVSPKQPTTMEAGEKNSAHLNPRVGGSSSQATHQKKEVPLDESRTS